jgi:hypothetical protein
MGKSTSEPLHGRNAATGMFCRGYVENKGDVLAPQSGHVSNLCGPNGNVIEPIDADCCQTDRSERLTRVHGGHPVWTRFELAEGSPVTSASNVHRCREGGGGTGRKRTLRTGIEKHIIGPADPMCTLIRMIRENVPFRASVLFREGSSSTRGFEPGTALSVRSSRFHLLEAIP